MSDTTRSDRYDAWLVPMAPLTKMQDVAGTTGTYQATGTDVGKLHVFVTAVDSLIERGTGAAVTVTTGTVCKAGVPLYFRPVTGAESLGFRSMDGATAYSATAPATVGLVEP